MASHFAKKIQKEDGGLHLSSHKGEVIEVRHAGEILKIKINGMNGIGQFTNTFVGPKSFLIRRPTPTDAKKDGEG